MREQEKVSESECLSVVADVPRAPHGASNAHALKAPHANVLTPTIHIGPFRLHNDVAGIQGGAHQAECPSSQDTCSSPLSAELFVWVLFSIFDKPSRQKQAGRAINQS